MLRCIGCSFRKINFFVCNRYPAGSVIKTVTKLTANHLGHLEFRLCKLKSSGELESEECFAQYPLKVKGGSTIYNLPNQNTGNFEVELTLPNIKCEQCVLQWTYVTG